MQSFPLSNKPTLMITLCLVIAACLWGFKVVALTKYSDCDPKSPGCGVPDYMVGVYQSGIAFSLARPIMRVVDEYIEERGVVPKDNASAGLLAPGEYRNSFVYDGYGIDVSSNKPVLKSIRWVSAGTLTGKIVMILETALIRVLQTKVFTSLEIKMDGPAVVPLHRTQST